MGRNTGMEFRLSAQDARRFWSKVDCWTPHGPQGECWRWTASLTSLGYGQFGIGQQMRKAHRIAWMLIYGTLPPGQCVLHSCDVPACVNPRHLRLGTQRENMAEAAERGRTLRGPLRRALALASVPRGSACPWSKLTEQDVCEIRERLKQGHPQTCIASEFGVHQVTISKIALRKTWAQMGESHAA